MLGGGRNCYYGYVDVIVPLRIVLPTVKSTGVPGTVFLLKLEFKFQFLLKLEVKFLKLEVKFQFFLKLKVKFQFFLKLKVKFQFFL